MTVAHASQAVVEQLVQVAAEASPVPAKLVFPMEAEAVASTMVAAAVAVQLPAQAQAQAPAPVDHVGCTVEQLDLARITC